MVTFSFYLFAIFLKKKWKLSKNNLREITRRYTRRFVAKKLSSLYLYAGTIFAETDRLESYLRWRIIEYPNVRLDFSVSTGEYRRTRKKTSFRWFVGFVPSFSVSLSLACVLHTAILKINAFENLAVSWLPVLVVSSSTELRVLSNRSVHGDIARVSLRSSVVVPSSHVLVYYTFLSFSFLRPTLPFRDFEGGRERQGYLEKSIF